MVFVAEDRHGTIFLKDSFSLIYRSMSELNNN